MSRPRPRLVRIEDDGERGTSFPLETGRTVIGRTDGDLVFSDDPLLSGTHASIVVEEGEGGSGQPARYVLRDEGSRNGSYVRIREPTELADGDLISVGRQVLRFGVRHPSAPLKRVR